MDTGGDPPRAEYGRLKIFPLQVQNTSEAVGSFFGLSGWLSWLVKSLNRRSSTKQNPIPLWLSVVTSDFAQHQDKELIVLYGDMAAWQRVLTKKNIREDLRGIYMISTYFHVFYIYIQLHLHLYCISRAPTRIFDVRTKRHRHPQVPQGKYLAIRLPCAGRGFSGLGDWSSCHQSTFLQVGHNTSRCGTKSHL